MNHYTILALAVLYVGTGISIFLMVDGIRRRQGVAILKVALRCAVWPLIILIGIWTDFIAPRWR